MESKKVEYYGNTRAASEIGSAVSAVIAAVLIFYSGNYRYVFLAAVIPYVVNLVNVATYPGELDAEIVTSKNVKEQLQYTLQDFIKIFKSFMAMKAIVNSSVFKAYFKITKDYLQPILEVFALSLPFFVALEETKRVSVVVGTVYFGIYLCTSYASKSSPKVHARFSHLSTAVNVTYVVGGIFLLASGFFAAYNIEVVTIGIFLLFYMLYNVRRPMTVSFVSDQISYKTMASGLSVESQVTTMLQAGIAVVIGALADTLGVGWALFIMGVTMVIGYPLIKVGNTQRV